MRLWTDCVSPPRDEAGYLFGDRLLVSTRRWLSLSERRLELARFEQKAWEYRWRCDMFYQSGIEQLLRDRLAAHGLAH